MKKISIKFIVILSVYLIGCLITAPLSLAADNTPTPTIVKPASKQTGFINFLLPKIQKVNNLIRLTRSKLQSLYDKFKQQQPLTEEEDIWITQLASQYKLRQTDISSDTTWQKLLSRVDIIPTPMALAQAANETAWGTSRFAKQGNNYFGQWCYIKGCGIVPKQRPKDATYEVRKFPNVEASIRSYMLNLNANKSYASLRKLRTKLRTQQQSLTGITLAAGLNHYSARGKAYVNSILSIINRYHLVARVQEQRVG